MKLRTNKPSSRTILTIAGVVVFERLCLRPDNEESKAIMAKEDNGETSIFPLDQAMGIDKLPFKMTFSVMLEVAKVAVDRTSFEVAAEELSERFQSSMSKDLVRDVTLAVGRIVYDEEKRLAEEARKMFESGSIPTSPQDIDDILYITTDGAHLNTREVLDGKQSSYHENKLAMIFAGKDVVTERVSPTETRRRIIRKQYVSLLYKNSDEFKWYILSLAIRAEYWRYKKLVFIADGAPWIRTVANELFPGCQRILDLCHLKENVGKYGIVVYPLKKDEKKRKKWINDTCELLEDGKWEEVRAQLIPFEGKKRKPGVPNLPNYLKENSDCIDYPAYIEAGYIVGSGSIESSNKSVAQVRFKQPGQRWDVEYGQCFITLRGKLKGNEWEYVRKLVLDFYMSSG